MKVRRPFASALALLLVGASLIGAATAIAAPPAGSVWHQARFDSTDGTSLHADVIRPVAELDRKTPVALLVSPYLGLPEPTGPLPPHVLSYYRRLYDALIAHGYSIVQVSLRGTGDSGGCEDLGGPGERGDVRAAVRWAASRPWSDGRVGMFGHSYDGYMALTALAERLGPVKAAIVIAPAVTPYRALFMGGIPYLQGREGAAYYQSFAAVPAGPPTSLDGFLETTDGRFVCGPQQIAAQQSNDPQSPFWSSRDLSPSLRGVRTPVLWTHGFLDGRDDFSATHPDNFLSGWLGLRGPRRAWFGQWPHVVPGERGEFAPQPLGRGGFLAEELRWFDRYVARVPASEASVGRDPTIELQDGAGHWWAETRWPPLDAQPVGVPVLPGAYRDQPGNRAEGSPPPGQCFAFTAQAEPVARCNPLAAPGRGTWSFTTPLRGPAHLAGVPRLRLQVEAAPGANLIAILYDVAANGRATMISRGAKLISRSGPVQLSLYPQDWPIRSGDRLGLLLSGADDGYFLTTPTYANVRVLSGTLEVPLLRCAPAHPLQGGPSREVTTRTSFPISAAKLSSREAPDSALPSTDACG